jgi:hypothetical protein
VEALPGRGAEETWLRVLWDCAGSTEKGEVDLLDLAAAEHY